MPSKKSSMQSDGENIKSILENVMQESDQFFAQLAKRPAAVAVAPIKTNTGGSSSSNSGLPSEGCGALETLSHFQSTYAPQLNGSAGPRYLGFVTGGATPAAVAGDWLTTVYDQSVSSTEDSCAGQMEMETIAMLRELFFIPNEFSGSFVSGATMANFVGLAQGRQWVAAAHGVTDVAEQGLYGLPPIKVLSGAPHSSIGKALSMLGMGRQSVQLVPCCNGNREAVDTFELRAQLEELAAAQEAQGRNPLTTPLCIVVANAGTVNTVDFDDLRAIAQLKEEFCFWLHVDAAFGGFAACSPTYKHLTMGMELADSLTIDLHKWLNVPYDSAIQLTRHKALQVAVFKNIAAYLGDPMLSAEFAHVTPENSRRFRALPAWFTLKAYGRQGYQQLVESNVAMALHLSDFIEKDQSRFRLVAPTRLNVVCFTPLGNTGADGQQQPVTLEHMQQLVQRLKKDGEAFMTPTVYKGVPAIRAAFSNWRTSAEDVVIIWNALRKAREAVFPQ